MENNRSSIVSKIFATLFMLITVAVMAVFIYGLVKLSFQNGSSSSEITNSISRRIAMAIFDTEPTEDQLFVMNRILRFSAHLILFASLGYGLGVVGMLIFRTPLTREFAIILDFGICAALAYFTEYYKQYIDGRHFQMEDVKINYMGALVGICFFLLSCVLHACIHARSKNKHRD